MVLLASSATLVITLAILHWNYVENNQRKMDKKHTILNHWGKQKPVQADLDKLYIEEPILEKRDTTDQDRKGKIERKQN